MTEVTTAEVIATQWRLHRYYGASVAGAAYYVAKFSIWLCWKWLTVKARGDT